MIPSFLLLLSKLVRRKSKQRFAILGKIFSRDLVLAYVAGVVLVVAYFTVTRSILALEFSQEFVGRVPW